MKRNIFINNILFVISFLVINLSYAHTPMWTFTPLTATQVAVPINSTATVQYRVTNQSNKSHTLVMTSIPGVSQTTSGAGVCGNPFALSPHASCILTLQVDGSAIAIGNTEGPIVCEHGSDYQCYRPAAIDTLNIEILYNVIVTISGLTDTVYLQNNGINSQAFSSNGAFILANLANGTSYDVTVAAQPTCQTCSIANGIGTINNAHANVTVICENNFFTVGGTVASLKLGETLVLQNNGGNDISIVGNGSSQSFVFSKPVENGDPYKVTVYTQPSGQKCTVSSGDGFINCGNVTGVNVSCQDIKLSSNFSNLALKKGGNTKVITITNTGSAPATNLTTTYVPDLPSGTTIVDSCAGVAALDPQQSCTISVNPRDSSISCNLTPYNAPTTTVVTVSDDNNTSVSTNVVILDKGCIYQEGYILSMIDHTSPSESISGTTVALSDLASYAWNIPTTQLLYIAQSLTDGKENTQGILSYSIIISSAAEQCVNYTICDADNNCYSQWYLPAICQMNGLGGDPSCPNDVPNISEDLALSGVNCAGTGSGCLSGSYWSSTSIVSYKAWYELFSDNSNSAKLDYRSFPKNIRCLRDFTSG